MSNDKVLQALLREIRDIELSQDEGELREAVAWLQGFAKAIDTVTSEESE